MKAAGLIFDFSPHYLDHLAPLCALLGWPLILCNSYLFETAKRFYPDVPLLETDAVGLSSWLEERFTHLVTCSPKPLLKQLLGSLPLKTFWLPHGNSDKGRIAPTFEALSEDTSALIYGQKMADFLSDCNVRIPEIIRVGLYRNLYYSQRAAPPLPISFAKKQRTILYAPTWQDAENNCSFWKAFPLLSQKLPPTVNLLVKPHPNTIAADEPALLRQMGRTERANLQFLLDYPPIFPLLEQCDAYLGDRSSIGYDFLFFDRPLFFLNPHGDPRGKELLGCGLSVEPETFFALLEHEDRFSKQRQEMLAYTFDDVSLNELRTRIYSACT